MAMYYYPELGNNSYKLDGSASRMPLSDFFKCAACASFHKPSSTSHTQQDESSIKLYCRMHCFENHQSA